MIMQCGKATRHIYLNKFFNILKETIIGDTHRMNCELMQNVINSTALP